MNSTLIHLMLADDDPDDRIFFKEALDELSLNSTLSTAEDGDQLMKLLSTSTTLPDVLFLDLNMPRKTGVECLAEIRANEKLNSLKVIIYSTSFDNEMVDLLYEKGALLYICKPGDYADLKKVIYEAITIASKPNVTRPGKEFFVIQIN